MKNKILPTYLQGNYRYSLGEFSNASYGVFSSSTFLYIKDKSVFGEYATKSELYRCPSATNHRIDVNFLKNTSDADI